MLFVLTLLLLLRGCEDPLVAIAGRHIRGIHTTYKQHQHQTHQSYTQSTQHNTLVQHLDYNAMGPLVFLWIQQKRMHNAHTFATRVFKCVVCVCVLCGRVITGSAESKA